MKSSHRIPLTLQPPDVGAFIYEEESMRERSRLFKSKRINDSAMKKYVELYRKVFGD